MLAEGLKRHVGLESLCLRDDGMTAEGVESLLEALSSDGDAFSHLTHLDLSGE